MFKINLDALNSNELVISTKQFIDACLNIQTVQIEAKDNVNPNWNDLVALEVFMKA